MQKEITRENAPSLKTGTFLVLYRKQKSTPTGEAWQAFDSGPLMYVMYNPRTVVLRSINFRQEIKLGYDRESGYWAILHSGLLDELCQSSYSERFLIKQDSRRLPVPPRRQT